MSLISLREKDVGAPAMYAWGEALFWNPPNFQPCQISFKLCRDHEFCSASWRAVCDDVQMGKVDDSWVKDCPTRRLAHGLSSDHVIAEYENIYLQTHFPTTMAAEVTATIRTVRHSSDMCIRNHLDATRPRQHRTCFLPNDGYSISIVTCTQIQHQFRVEGE